MTDLKARVRDLMPGLLDDLGDLVRIQSVSADPARLGEVEKSAARPARSCGSRSRLGRTSLT